MVPEPVPVPVGNVVVAEPVVPEPIPVGNVVVAEPVVPEPVPVGNVVVAEPVVPVPLCDGVTDSVALVGDDPVRENTALVTGVVPVMPELDGAVYEVVGEVISKEKTQM